MTEDQKEQLTWLVHYAFYTTIEARVFSKEYAETAKSLGVEYPDKFFERMKALDDELKSQFSAHRLFELCNYLAFHCREVGAGVVSAKWEMAAEECWNLISMLERENLTDVPLSAPSAAGSSKWCFETQVPPGAVKNLTMA